jgi:hypothetical protein
MARQNDDVKRIKTLMVITQKMVGIAQNHGGLPEEFFILFEKAKRIKLTEDRDSLIEAVKNI